MKLTKYYLERERLCTVDPLAEPHRTRQPSKAVHAAAAPAAAMAKGKLGAKGAAVSGVKNKIKRQQLYHKLRKQGDKEQKAARKLRQKETVELGEVSPMPL
eukprot:6208990-Pleurochrysis_carterae.AAC.5